MAALTFMEFAWMCIVPSFVEQRAIGVPGLAGMMEKTHLRATLQIRGAGCDQAVENDFSCQTVDW